MCGLHPCSNVTNRLVGTLGWQPGRVGHGSDLEVRQPCQALRQTYGQALPRDPPREQAAGISQGCFKGRHSHPKADAFKHTQL